MINRPTVLILGAGASRPYGYPSGGALLEEIVRELRAGGPGTVFRQRLQGCGFSPEKIEAFRDALFRSARRSVDAFLEHRTEFSSIGRFAIALSLLQWEHEDNLFKPESMTVRGYPRGEISLGSKWYGYLFDAMSARPEHFGENRLSVITFNYDRSLEHFLYRALQNAYGLDEEAATRLTRSIAVFHVHGSLLPLPHQGEDGREYMPVHDRETVRRCADGIRIISDIKDENAAFGPAREALASAEIVGFLGFGYDDTNLQRLQLERVPSRSTFRGSAFDITPEEQNRINERHRARTKRLIIFRDRAEHEDGLEFLRRSSVLS